MSLSGGGEAVMVLKNDSVTLVEEWQSRLYSRGATTMWFSSRGERSSSATNTTRKSGNL